MVVTLGRNTTGMPTATSTEVEQLSCCQGIVNTVNSTAARPVQLYSNRYTSQAALEFKKINFLC